MTLDEAIKELEERAFWKRDAAEMAEDDNGIGNEVALAEAAEDEQLAEWLKELKDLREENKVLIQECDRLIKEKGELLKKSEQIAEYKRLLKAAVEDFKEICVEIFSHKYCKWYSKETDKCIRPDDTTCEQVTDWKHADEALKLIGGSENG